MWKPTEQMIFSQVFRGLRAQHWEQSLGDLGCSYRGAWGRKCAVGHLVWDEVFDSGDLDPDSCISTMLLHIGLQDLEDFISCLVDAHDKYSSPPEMKAAFDQIAEDHSLKVPPE